MELLVAAKDIVAEGVVALRLVDAGGAELPEWAPGAHIDLLLPGGLERQYSLCGDPADRSAWHVAVLREVDGRGGSQYVHDMLVPGDRVGVGGPRNHFALAPSQRYLFIAGGIGITPLLPMIHAVDAAGADWQLVYGGRTRSSMAFRDELSRYGDRVELCPQDETGLLDLRALLGEPRADTQVYCCGPEPLLRAVEDRCGAWPVGSLHVERFSPKQFDAPEVEATFEVVLERSGKTIKVPPDQSVLHAVEEAGVTVLSSCQEGTCGTCETAVLEGVPDHRDSILTAAERASCEFMMICVSRSCSPRLVLDL